MGQILGGQMGGRSIELLQSGCTSPLTHWQIQWADDPDSGVIIAVKSTAARSSNVPIRLHLGASRTVIRGRISALGCQGGRGSEIHVPRAFAHAAACLRVQARQ
jgi:hypothetical protein